MHRGQENLGKLFKALHLIYLTKTPVYFLSKKCHDSVHRALHGKFQSQCRRQITVAYGDVLARLPRAAVDCCTTQLCPEVGISRPCPPPSGCQLFSSFSHEVHEDPSPTKFPEHRSVDEGGPPSSLLHWRCYCSVVADGGRVTLLWGPDCWLVAHAPVDGHTPVSS